MGQYALTLAAAAVAIEADRGPRPAARQPASAPWSWLAVIAAAGAFFVVNLLLVTRATSLYESTPLMEALRSDLVFSLSVGMVLLCLAPIVVTVLDFSPALFPLFFIPLFGIYSSGRQAARAAKAEHEATHDSLTGCRTAAGSGRRSIGRFRTRRLAGQPSCSSTSTASRT